MRWLIALATMLPLASAAATTAGVAEDDAAVARAIAGRTAGKPSLCIDQARLNGPEIINGRTIIYRQSGRRIWVSRLKEECRWLQGDPILVAQSSGSQLCRNDRFDVLQRNSPNPAGFCLFGDFVPYDRVDHPKAR